MAILSGVLFDDPIDRPLSNSGQFQPGCYRLFYLTGSTTPTPVYADAALTTPLSQTPGQAQPSCTADGFGRFNPIYMDPSIVYRCQLFSVGNILLQDVDPYVPPLAGTAFVRGQFTIGTTGFVTPPSGTAVYHITNGTIVDLFIPTLGTSTSNAVTFTLTGIPVIIQPNFFQNQEQQMGAVDNGAEIVGNFTIGLTVGVIGLENGAGLNNWTPTGQKGVGNQTFRYWLK